MIKDLIQPPFLSAGDTIGIVSTARKISKEEISPAVQYLENCGFHVQSGKTIGAEYHQFAGDDELRAADLQAMLDDPDIKAILCARGGYGTLRILDKIVFERFIASPKWIAGYSDITALHQVLNTKLGVQSLHSPMAIGFESLTVESQESLVDALSGKTIKYSWENNSLNKTGECRGIVFGGNLSVMYSLSGTPGSSIPSDAILFLEDLDEYLYHIDRMMMNLKRGDKLSGLAGLIIGGMSDMRDNEIPFGKKAEDIIREHINDGEFPVSFGFPAGHIADNRTLVLGRQAKLSVRENISELIY